jgi:hypothetical protein
VLSGSSGAAQRRRQPSSRNFEPLNPPSTSTCSSFLVDRDRPAMPKDAPRKFKPAAPNPNKQKVADFSVRSLAVCFG